MKELIRLRNPEDSGEAGAESARPLVIKAIDDFLEYTSLNLLFLRRLVLVAGFFRVAKQHFLDFILGHLGIKTEKSLIQLSYGLLLFKRI